MDFTGMQCFTQNEIRNLTPEMFDTFTFLDIRRCVVIRFLRNDNAPVHTSTAAKQKFTDLGFTQVEHPPYSPDLAPSDFHFFRCLKKHLRGNNFHSSGDLKQAVIDFIENCSPIFFEDGFNELVIRWKKCINVNGNYVEK